MTDTLSPHHVRNKAPRWLVVIYALGVIPLLVMAGVMLAGIGGAAGNGLNEVVSLAIAGGAVAALSVQVSALSGLLAHRHWAREVALLAQLFWVLGAFGFLVSGITGGGVGFFATAVVFLAMGFVTARTLWRGWDLGPAPVYAEAIHPHGWVTWESALGAALVLPFVGFVVWVLNHVRSLAPSVSLSTWVTIGILVTLMTLPWFLVHAFAAHGLDHRHDYGLVVAIIGGVLWFFTVIGIPIGLAQLYSVWKVSHPVLALPSRLAPTRGGAQA
jgi:hypothetical protein